VAQTANLGVFKAIYRDMDSNDGWVHKTLLLQEVRKKTQKGQQTIYNWWKKSIGEYFEENKINKSVYVKLKEDMT
jgi:hypothetical protein